MEDNLVASGKAVLDPAQLATDLANVHVADIVEVLDQQPVEAASRVLMQLSVERAAEVLDQPGLGASPELIASLPQERATAVLSAMSADRVANVFRHLNGPVRSKLLSRLDPEAKISLQELLAYPPNTAGSIMTTEFVSVPETWRIGQTLEHIRRVGRTRETVYAIYVLHPTTKALVQTVSLRRLITV
jgi:magnesium transporter